MNAATIIASLDLPTETRVDKRVAKKLLMEQGAPTAADKRQIQDGIEELTWIAALKPSNIGVPAYRDDVRDYLEIAVLAAELRPKAKAARLTELIHRAIPYPLVLVTTHGDGTNLSLAHKRTALNDASTTVLDGPMVVSPQCGSPVHEASSPMTEGFLNSLSLGLQPRVHLCAMYQGWIERVEALRAGCITGRFALAASPRAAAERRYALLEYDRSQHEIINLRARAVKESQMNRRVDLNLTIRRLEDGLAASKSNM